MPEANKRVVLKGTKQAEREFDKYIRLRIAAEKDAGALEGELKKTLAALRKAQREAARG